MTKAQAKAADRAEAIKTLRQLGVKPGATIYTNVTHVARSGMSRHITCHLVTRNTSTDREGRKKVEHGMTNITGLVAVALDWSRAKDGALNVGGCGMDMCFHTVYCLGRAMFPNGGSLSKTNGIRERQAQREGETRETDGGYLLHKRDL